MEAHSGQPVLDYEPSAEQVRRSGSRWVRVAVVVGILAVWFIATMGGASANTLIEHHPFGGPFILIRESRATEEFALSMFVCACIFVPATAWVWSGKWWAGTLAILGSCLSVLLSYFFAMAAWC